MYASANYVEYSPYLEADSWWEMTNILQNPEVYYHWPFKRRIKSHQLALLGAHHILHVSSVRVNKYF